MGYHQAGFEVIGVDIDPQPNYPFDFVQADVFDVLAVSPEYFPDLALIHASPPCQHHTRYRNVVKDITDRYEDHCESVVELLAATGIPSVVENVEGSHLHADIKLCGSMFGLDVRRHREFQLIGWDAMSPPCNHKVWTERKYKSSSTRKNKRFTIEVGAWDEPLELQKEAMGVDWDIELRELSQAIPPAYTKFIGDQFLEQQERCPSCGSARWGECGWCA